MSTTARPEHTPRTEAERAAYYDAHRAQVEAWPEVPPPADAEKPKQRGVILSARFTTDEATAIEEAAHARGLSVSAFLRSVAQEAAGTAAPPVNTARIADRLVALAAELRPSPTTRRGSATVTAPKRTASKAAASSTKVLRDGRTSKPSKTASGALNQRTKKTG